MSENTSEQLKRQFGAAGILMDVKHAYNRLADFEEMTQEMLQEVRKTLETAIDVLVLYDKEEQKQKEQEEEEEEEEEEQKDSTDLCEVTLYSSDFDPEKYPEVEIETVSEEEEEEQKPETSLYHLSKEEVAKIPVVEVPREPEEEEEEEEEEKPEQKPRKKNEALPFTCLNEVDMNRKSYMAYRHQYYKVLVLFEKVAEDPKLEDDFKTIESFLKKDAPTVRKLKKNFQRAHDFWKTIKKQTKPKSIASKINKTFHSMKAILEDI